MAEGLSQADNDTFRQMLGGEIVDMSSDVTEDHPPHPMYMTLLEKGYTEEEILIMTGFEE